ncbi:Chorismate mutase 3 [Diplonema papillatum]|nr:Chorismate mutase 3 [Diplonema papillatum]
MLDPVWSGDSGTLKLDSFRGQLIRQEETIIFALIERAQFKANLPVYGKESGVNGLSLLDYMMRESEIVHARVRRFTSPDEHAFFPEVLDVQPILPALDYPRVIMPNQININEKIKSLYTNSLIPKLTEPGVHPESYGSTTVSDIACLQALSKRIHFGKFIAEAKFQADTPRYTELINNNDSDGLMQELTNLKVEEMVLNRVELKADTYGTDPQNKDSGCLTGKKISSKLIRDLYAGVVMPLTKEVQVQYLLQRLKHPMIAVAVCPSPLSDPSMDIKHVNAALTAHFGAEVLQPPSVVSQCSSIDAVFSHVLSNKAAFGVVLLESSTGGVHKATKLSLISSGIKISGEILVQTDDGVTLRYVVLSKSSTTRSGWDKTCIALAVKHETGALFKVLQLFQEHGINLCCIESLPAAAAVIGSDPGKGSFAFLIEAEGHAADASLAAALSSLSASATFVRILGSYPNKTRRSS